MSGGQILAILIAVIGGFAVIGDWLGKSFVRWCEKPTPPTNRMWWL